MELEKELKMRVWLHKVAIVKSAIASSYMSHEAKKGGLMLSRPCLEQNAIEYSDKVMAEVLLKGKLDEAYDKAWECVGELMPDDFCVMD